MKTCLIGHTGFVGANLAEQFQFNALYNSKNIAEIEGHEFDLVVCAGVSAAKWRANQAPEHDKKEIEKLKQHLLTIKAQKIILISTIDIYDTPKQVNEDTSPDINKQDYYGKHRYQLEQWVQKQFVDYHILRLPGLFGNYIKKNLIFDILNPLAKSINKSLWLDLQSKLGIPSVATIKKYYQEDEFGNLQQLANISSTIKNQLIAIFAEANFSTLNFTDSRSSFQFYNLANLWQDIQQYAFKQNISILNVASEPIIASEIVLAATGREFKNYLASGWVSYDMHTKYSESNYLYNKTEILEQIIQFIARHRIK